MFLLALLFYFPVKSQNIFGLSSSVSFVLDSSALSALRRIDSLALSNTGCIRYPLGSGSPSRYNVFTGTVTNPDQDVVCAFHTAETLTWTPQSGFVLLGVNSLQIDQINYGSMIVMDAGSTAVLVSNITDILAVHRNGTVATIHTSPDPILGLYSDTTSKVAYLALDTAGFYFGFPLDSTRQVLRVASETPIFVGGNLLNSKPQVLRQDGLLEAPPELGVALTSDILFPLLTREPITILPSQTLPDQPVFTVPVIIGPGGSFQLSPNEGQTYFQDLQIGSDAVLILDLGGSAYGTGDSLDIFTYAAASGQFSQIVLLNYASSSCLVLSADGQFTGTSFYVTFTADLSCTSSATRHIASF